MIQTNQKFLVDILLCTCLHEVQKDSFLKILLQTLQNWSGLFLEQCITFYKP